VTGIQRNARENCVVWLWVVAVEEIEDRSA
jgi:hypothetical protein